MFGDVPSPLIIGYISDNYAPIFTLGITILSMAPSILLWMVVLFLPVERGIDLPYSDGAIRRNSLSL